MELTERKAELVMRRWEAGAEVAAMAAVIGLTERQIHNLVQRRRAGGDPRAVERRRGPKGKHHNA